MAAVPTLWFDDEWASEREAALRPWIRTLDQLQTAGILKVTYCSRLADFSRCLREGWRRDSSEAAAPFSLLIIDIMLTEELEESYDCLGFPKERVDPFEAGAQIAELLRSSRFDSKRPDWLASYVDAPMLALSSSPSFRSQIERRVGYRRLSKLEMISKGLRMRSGSDGVDAKPDFEQAIRRLVALP